MNLTKYSSKNIESQLEHVCEKKTNTIYTHIKYVYN